MAERDNETPFTLNDLKEGVEKIGETVKSDDEDITLSVRDLLYGRILLQSEDSNTCPAECDEKRKGLGDLQRREIHMESEHSKKKQLTIDADVHKKLSIIRAKYETTFSGAIEKLIEIKEQADVGTINTGVEKSES